MKHDPDAFLAHRVRYLPGALEAARRKVMALENEARRYRMWDLLTETHGMTSRAVLTDTAKVDRAWDRETEIARLNSADRAERNA